jgi:hypothetical protein
MNLTVQQKYIIGGVVVVGLIGYGWWYLRKPAAQLATTQPLGSLPGAGVPAGGVPGSGVPGASVPGGGLPGGSVPGGGLPGGGPGGSVPGGSVPGGSTGLPGYPFVTNQPRVTTYIPTMAYSMPGPSAGPQGQAQTVVNGWPQWTGFPGPQRVTIVG